MISDIKIIESLLGLDNPDERAQLLNDIVKEPKYRDFYLRCAGILDAAFPIEPTHLEDVPDPEDVLRRIEERIDTGDFKEPPIDTKQNS